MDFLGVKMTVICPKCKYQRTLEDDEIFPNWQCPKCEIAYNKFKDSGLGGVIGIAASKKVTPKISPKKHSKSNKNIFPTIPKSRKKFIEESLSKDEEIQSLFEFNWVVKIPMYILASLSFIFLFLIILSVIFSAKPQGIGTGLLLSAFFLGVAIYEYFRLTSLEMGATNKRLIIKTGIISRKTEEMRLAAIETVELNQSVTERLLGMGTVKITGVGVSILKFHNIDEPMEVKKKIENIRAHYL
jgi:membrane protein YdbS with pleckstrin-like domain